MLATSTALNPTVPCDNVRSSRARVNSTNAYHVELWDSLIPNFLRKFEVDQPRTAGGIYHDVVVANIAMNPSISVQNG